jgi:hypothetical protein
VSASVGHFQYDTDGFRSNNDLEHDIANAYLQWAVSPELNLQTEYLWRDTEHGDLRQNFDLDDRDETFRRDLESHVWRTGARYSPTQQSDLLFSYIHSDTDSGGQSVPVDIPDVIKVSEQQSQNDKADQFEGQYLFRAERFNLQAGAAHADADVSGAFTATALITIPPPVPGLPPLIIDDVQVFPTDSRTRDTRGYVYTNIQLPYAILATVGASYQDYDGELTSDGISNNFDRFNPKVGIRWNLMPNLTARAAYFETVKPVLVSNRTLEPTQVAGFYKFLDAPAAPRWERFGARRAWRPVKELKVGGELTRRNVESPVVNFAALAMNYEDRDEWQHRAYVFWEPAARWALGVEGIYDKFTNASDSIVSNIVPSYVRSWTVPTKVSYFDPRGWFASLGVTYVDQTVRRNATQSVLAQGSSDFALVDLAFGYRLPARRGMLSLVFMNLFDKDFDYQDNSYRTFSDQPYVGPYVPERVVMARMTVSY